MHMRVLGIGLLSQFESDRPQLSQSNSKNKECGAAVPELMRCTPILSYANGSKQIWVSCNTLAFMHIYIYLPSVIPT